MIVIKNNDTTQITVFPSAPEGPDLRTLQGCEGLSHAEIPLHSCQRLVYGVIGLRMVLKNWILPFLIPRIFC